MNKMQNQIHKGLAHGRVQLVLNCFSEVTEVNPKYVEIVVLKSEMAS